MSKKAQIINGLLGILNLRLTRVITPDSGSREVRIGPFVLATPPESPLPHEYRKHPVLNSAISRMAALVHQKYPSMTYIDAGANIGDTVAIVKAQTDVPVVAVEGDEQMFAVLQRNMVPIRDVHLVPMYVGEAPSQLEVKVSKEGWNATLIPAEPSSGPATGSRVLKISTLDLVMDAHPQLPPAKFVKVDAEGYDLRIIRGARRLIEAHRPALHFEYNLQNINALQENGLNIFQFLKNAGYRQLLVWDSLGRFMISTELDQDELIHDLHEYSEGGMVLYYDLCVFHESDKDLADRAIAGERSFRRESTSGT